ncbi:MAG TPA: 3-oxoacyl-[acyl-carrier-protein] reductase [Nitrospiria bacterium]|nr:3-oxoacyl-[acyl-carrier-protein] reductase [Nitrospiria bacterium]
MNLDGQIAIVTGGAQGIGKAIVQVLIQSGADVVVADMNLDRARETVSELEVSGRRLMAVGVNVAESKQVTEMVDRVVKEWGRLDILVNNAGITRDGLLLRMSEEDWNRVMDVNLKGTFHCTKAVLPFMIRQRRGRIVNIASIVGAMGNAGQANYAASKAAVIGFTKSAAREYASRGITVNAVAPGFIDTALTQNLSQEVRDLLLKQIPLARLGTAMDVAYAVRFLISEEAGYITGQVIHVNGGMLMI